MLRKFSSRASGAIIQLPKSLSTTNWCADKLPASKIGIQEVTWSRELRGRWRGCPGTNSVFSELKNFYRSYHYIIHIISLSLASKNLCQDLEFHPTFESFSVYTQTTSKFSFRASRNLNFEVVRVYSS